MSDQIQKRLHSDGGLQYSYVILNRIILCSNSWTI